ncbi:hypothetical protein ACFTAO_36345 [Paenibacillus rhizoplanae]
MDQVKLGLVFGLKIIGKNVHRISAQKSLNIPREVSTKSKGVALEEFLLRQYQ